MRSTCSLHPGFTAALEFEEQRIGLPFEVHRRHLLDLPRRSSFRPIIDVNVHTAATNENFPVRFDDEILEIHAPAFVVDDQEVFGYRNNGGDVAALVGVTGNRVSLYFDLDLVFRMPERVRRTPTNGVRSAANPGARLADLVLSAALTRAGRNVRAYTWKAEREAYARLKLQAQERHVDEARRAIRENDIAIEDRTWQIRTLAEKNVQLRAQVRGYERLTRRMLTRHAIEDHARIVQMLGRGLRSFEIENSLLMAVTAPVEITWDDVRYQMGCYCIHLPLGTGRLAIHPETGCTEVEGFFHPHVNSDGNPCLGNIGGSLAQLLGEGEHAQALALLLEFLRSYNPDNPYIKLERWDPYWEDEDDRWERCYNDSSLHDCATCDDWDCPHREGAESRCYDYTDTEDCIACAGCERHRDAIESCRSERVPEDCVACDQDCTYAGDEEACHESHDGERCADCDNNDCNHHPQENDDDEDPS